MTSAEKLEKIICKNPGAHLHFHDNGSWVITKKPPGEDGYAENVRYLAEGSFQDSSGYLPELVEVLAKIAGLTADSI